MGLYMTCSYPKFSIEDVEKFERRMVNWCSYGCTKGVSMLIFDKEDLKVNGTLETLHENNLPYQKLVLPQITLAYTHVQGTDMCIMYKIWDNQTQKVIYKMPSRWDGTELWLGK